MPPSSTASGYEHPAYAQSLAGFGIPRLLRRCGGWLLERGVPGSTGARDAMGCYPVFACHDWSRLHLDLEELSGVVSLALVTDPFGDYDEDYLRRSFGDVCVPFKEHFIADLNRVPVEYVDAHHRRNARRALVAGLSVEVISDPPVLLDDWCALYATLTERHGIRGLTSFSRESFAAQLAVPGLTALHAVRGGETIGMTLWYESRGVGYYHLGAYSPTGYDLRASFALFWRAFEHFADAGLRWLNLGAGAGLGDGQEDGLSRFKRGWSTGTRTAYFCGRVFDRRRYEELARTQVVSPAARYFPSYREGEFR